jgi:hypothetical protein
MSNQIQFEDIKFEITYPNNRPHIQFKHLPASISKIQIDLDLPIISLEHAIDVFESLIEEIKLVRKKLKELKSRNSTIMVEQLRKNALVELRSLEREYVVAFLASYDSNLEV